MRRFIPWVDIAVYGGLALLSVAASLLAVLTPQEWTNGKIVLAVATPLVFVVLAVIIVSGKWSKRPDYILGSGVAVWTAGDKRPHLQCMTNAIAHFAISASGLVCDHKTMKKFLFGICVEWTTKRVGMIGYGWKVTDKAGLQSGKHIKLQWTGSIKESALFHELGHMVQELILKRPTPDYKHEDPFWNIISEIERSYEP